MINNANYSINICFNILIINSEHLNVNLQIMIKIYIKMLTTLGREFCDKYTNLYFDFLFRYFISVILLLFEKSKLSFQTSIQCLWQTPFVILLLW